MSHEPECGDDNDGTFMPYYRICVCDPVRAAYRRGYNDHARSRAYAEQVYGPYPMSQRLGTFDRSRWNQHGQGESP